MIQVSKPKKIKAYTNMPVVSPKNLSVNDINNLVGFNVESLFTKATDVFGDNLEKDRIQKSYLRNLLIIYLKFSYVPVKDISFIMNLSTSRVFKIINRSMIPIFGKSIEADFRTFYILYKRIKPISETSFTFEEEIENDIKQRFFIFIRSVMEHYLYYWHYKDEQLTSNIIRLATEYKKLA
ncbi:hypothetical protein [Gilliamella sp. BG6]|uniref:hypothetical protein n=1 Tax=unclassified Gilliamella TaxID=2685620 RepID=UPI0039861210